MTSLEHRANSRDPGPRPSAKGSDPDYPSTQEGPWLPEQAPGSCPLSLPWWPSTNKYCGRRLIRMEFLFNTLEPHQPRHRTWSTWLFLNPFFTFHVSALVIPSLRAVVQWGNMLVFSATWGFSQRQSGRHPGPDPSPPTGKRLCSQEQAPGTRKIVPCPRGQDTQNYSGKLGLWHFPLFRMLISVLWAKFGNSLQARVSLFFLGPPGRMPRNTTDPAMRTLEAGAQRLVSHVAASFLGLSFLISKRRGLRLLNPQHPFRFNPQWSHWPMWYNKSFCLIVIAAQIYKRMDAFNFETHLYVWNSIPLSICQLFILSFNKYLC